MTTPKLSAVVLVADGSHPYSETLIRAAQESFVAGWQQTMWAGVVVMAILLGYVLVRGPQRSN